MLYTHVSLFTCYHNNIIMLIQLEFGMEVVCTVYDFYLRFTVNALTGNSTAGEPGDSEEYLNDISSQYVLQRVMESACRWVNTDIPIS